MEPFALSLNVIAVAICFIFIGVLVQWLKNRNSVQSRTILKLPLLYLAKAFFSCKNDLEMRMRLFEMVQSACKLYDRQRFTTFSQLGLKHAHFYKPETVQVLLSNAVETDKAKEYRLLQPWLGIGLLTSSKNKWRGRRKLLTPAFHFSILKDFIPVFNEHSFKLVEKLSSLTERDWIDVVPVIKFFTLDAICETAMGINLSNQHGNIAEYAKAIDEIAGAFVIRNLNPFLQNDILYYSLPQGWRFSRNLKLLHNFTRQVIKEKKALHFKNRRSPSTECDGLKTRKAFLELLLEQHFLDETFTEEDIREEVDTFMFGGHDTTATAISWTLYCLGLYPEIQETVYEELKSVFIDDPQRSVTFEDLSNMNYLERVIKESLRIYPPAPIVARKLKETIQVRDNTVTPDFTCIIDIFVLHRDEENFPNPEKFDPDRFLPENFKQIHPFAYIPFSAGPRNCIGQKFAMIELKIVLAHVLRNFKVISLDQRDKIKLAFGFILRSIDPLRMKFVARQ